MDNNHSSLSLFRSNPALITPNSSSPEPPLSNLPTELVIYIFTLAASVHKPTAASLARTCRLVREWVEPILYRTVVLHTKAQSELFERTVRSKDPSFFETYLKHFAPVAGHEELSIIQSPTRAGRGYHSFEDVEGESNGSAIPNGCPVPHSSGSDLTTRPPHAWHGGIKGVRSLLLSSLCRPTDESTGHARPSEVAIKGFVKARFFSYPAFEGVTHLFLCEVPMVFTNVLSEIVEARIYLPSLTHLACPFANRWRGPEQDVKTEVCTLLGIGQEEEEEEEETTNAHAQTTAAANNNTHPNRPPLSRLNTTTAIQKRPRPKPLQMLLLNVFHFSLPDLERESSIWRSLASLPIDETEGRLFLQPGEMFSVRRWEESVSGVSLSFGGKGGGGRKDINGNGIEGDLEDVWSEARRRAEGWRSWVRN